MRNGRGAGVCGRGVGEEKVESSRSTQRVGSEEAYSWSRARKNWLIGNHTEYRSESWTTSPPSQTPNRPSNSTSPTASTGCRRSPARSKRRACRKAQAPSQPQARGAALGCMVLDSDGQRLEMAEWR